MRLMIPALILIFSPPLMAEDKFLEGFPDVPALDAIRAFEGEPVIFDTPSGTVAEATLLLNGQASHAMHTYRESLVALGWTCDSPSLALTCRREGNRLIFKTPDPHAKNGRLILRLEPAS